MGLLVEGEWRDQWYDTDSSGGKFEREESSFRRWVTPNGSAGPSGEDGFMAEANRYHLYVSLACPWAHRALIFRKLKGLEDLISLDVVHYHMGDEGWTFGVDAECATGDTVNGKDKLYEVYLAAQPDYTGRVTVPVLWDKTSNTIVNNESSEIIRMFNSAFDGLGAKEGDYYPEELREEIDEINASVYENINNGVYKAGFATTQEAYEDAFNALFDALDMIEDRLARQRYLVGDRITEADWRLFTTLVRFDPVYVGHFKCNRQRISDFPQLSNYLRDLYQVEGISETVNLTHIKRHYYGSHESVNPNGIVPAGPVLDYSGPHDRTRFG